MYVITDISSTYASLEDRIAAEGYLGVGHVGSIEDGWDVEDFLRQVNAALCILGPFARVERLGGRQLKSSPSPPEGLWRHRTLWSGHEPGAIASTRAHTALPSFQSLKWERLSSCMIATKDMFIDKTN